MSILKLSWGTRIALIYGGFIVLISSLVWGSMKQNIDLVSDDYYQKELKYQNIIDAGKNQAALSAPAAFSADDRNLYIHFPSEFNSKIVKGNVQLYSDVSAGWDKQFQIEGAGTSIAISRRGIHKTVYKAKLSWVCENKEFYQESVINLNQ